MARPNLRDLVATIATLAILLPALYFAFVAIDRWAAHTFARPILASALVAVCDLGVFAVAICVAPALSRLLRLLLGRPEAAPAPPKPSE